MHIQMEGFILVLWMFVNAVHANPNASCWAKDDRPDIVVGFDIGMTHGAATVAFGNGSFMDIVRLEAGPAYQACVLQRIQVEGLNQSMSRYTALSDKNELRVRTQNSTAISNLTELCDADSAQRDLEALIQGMKTQTEGLLQEQISNLTVTTPDFLPEAVRLEIKLALGKASLHLSSCGDIEDSIIASTLATRLSQLPSRGGRNISAAECLLGPFGVEEVIAVTYTESILALSVFKLYTGK
ncbi:uncharacterized protein LY89DRAFT_183606 [Mollisia scopiformis]|uniref:Uncharacterized protein n=1 Tax=Mollisia scopiformis TaxID=149040 RepID=A0A194XUU8_MOLSC|nr:uncharacterized protein LY89DRAFT_183606 [Mollisia scopiformis]KUJ23482.1 hypothetical protein LY89DRAFT_183606 [Mollisia scopiformis]